MICVSEAVAGAEGVGVVFAQDTGAVGQDLLVQGDGLIEATGMHVCACEVVAEGERVGVVCTQDPDVVGQKVLV